MNKKSHAHAAPFGRLLVEAHGPCGQAARRAVQPDVGQDGEGDDDDEGDRHEAPALQQLAGELEADGPAGCGRSHREIPCRMLSVARVAMIDDSFRTRIRKTLTAPVAKATAMTNEHAE